MFSLTLGAAGTGWNRERGSQTLLPSRRQTWSDSSETCSGLREDVGVVKGGRGVESVKCDTEVGVAAVAPEEDNRKQ